MQSILRDEIGKNLSIGDLKKIVPRYCMVKRYDQVRGKSLKEVLKGRTCLILLWNIHDKKHRVLNQPGHFFMISTRGPEPCVVFSSTGMTPKKELFITQSNPTLLDEILPEGTVYNSVKLQQSKDANTCWRWNIVFAHLAPMGLKKFQELFRGNMHVSTPDELVTAMTLLLTY